MLVRIVIHDYDPSWPSLFDAERRLIRAAIGDSIVGIEHIGSTAVPGLGAKPIIDVMIGLEALDVADRGIVAVEDIGYTFVTEATRVLPDDRYFERWSEGVEVAHLHLTEFGCPFWRDHVLFRDFLRTHPEEAAQYERVKRTLAPQHTSGYTYSQAKTEFIVGALARARDEARGA